MLNFPLAACRAQGLAAFPTTTRRFYRGEDGRIRQHRHALLVMNTDCASDVEEMSSSAFGELKDQIKQQLLCFSGSSLKVKTEQEAAHLILVNLLKASRMGVRGARLLTQMWQHTVLSLQAAFNATRDALVAASPALGPAASGGDAAAPLGPATTAAALVQGILPPARKAFAQAMIAFYRAQGQTSLAAQLQDKLETAQDTQQLLAVEVEKATALVQALFERTVDIEVNVAEESEEELCDQLLQTVSVTELEESIEAVDTYLKSDKVFENVLSQPPTAETLKVLESKRAVLADRVCKPLEKLRDHFGAVSQNILDALAFLLDLPAGADAAQADVEEEEEEEEDESEAPDAATSAALAELRTLAERSPRQAVRRGQVKLLGLVKQLSAQVEVLVTALYTAQRGALGIEDQVEAAPTPVAGAEALADASEEQALADASEEQALADANEKQALADANEELLNKVQALEAALAERTCELQSVQSELSNKTAHCEAVERSYNDLATELEMAKKDLSKLQDEHAAVIAPSTEPNAAMAQQLKALEEKALKLTGELGEARSAEAAAQQSLVAAQNQHEQDLQQQGAAYQEQLDTERSAARSSMESWHVKYNEIVERQGVLEASLQEQARASAEETSMLRRELDARDDTIAELESQIASAGEGGGV